jgi:hypothetical protein
MRDLRKELKEKHGMDIDYDFNRLSVKYAKEVLDRRAKEQEDNEEFEAGIDYHSLIVAKNKIAQELEREADRVHGNLPICSIEDALTVVKVANTDRRDIGVNNLETYLMNLWKKNASYTITAEHFLKIRDTFTKNYPKSKVAGLIDEICSEGYMSLYLPELVDIASRIASQEDFEYEIRMANLDGNQPTQRKAREFILAVVNGEIE